MCAVQWGCGDTIRERRVSLVYRTRWNTLPDVAFPPVGRLGLTCTCTGTIRRYDCHHVPLGLLRLSLASRYLVCFRAFVVSLPGSWSSGSPQPRQGLWSPGSLLRAGHQGDRWLSQGPEFPCEDMPRSQTQVVSCALAKAHPGLLPSSACKPSAYHHATHFGAPSRGLPSRYTRLRTAPYGEARGFATDLLARL